MPQVGALAARQLDDYDSHHPGMLFSEGLALDVQQGYELQNAVAALRYQRGEQLIGYKVGCTSSAIQEQLKITHRVRGLLFDTEQHESGVALSRQSFANLAIEGELAIELSREPREEDFTGHLLPGCISRIFPVIELHHHVMRGQQASAGELIANNAIHAGFVSGDGRPVIESFFWQRCLMKLGLKFFETINCLVSVKVSSCLRRFTHHSNGCGTNCCRAMTDFAQDKLFSRGRFQTCFQ